MALSVQVGSYTAPEAVDGRGVGVQSLPVNDGEVNLRLVQLAPRIAAYRLAMRSAPCSASRSRSRVTGTSRRSVTSLFDRRASST